MGLLDRRRLLLACDKELPPQYKRIEYAETIGDDYIDTGVVPSNNLGFDIDFMAYSPIANKENMYGCVMGGRYASGNNDIQFTTFIANNTANWGGTTRFGPNTTESSRDAGIIPFVRQKASLHDLVFTNASGVSASVSPYSWTSNARSIYLFGLNNNNTFAQAGNGCRIYSAKLYNDNTLVRNYIPCRGHLGIGMYETVNKTFYAISKFPDGYERLEYIQTDGTQYINTGVSPSSYIGFAITFLTNNVFDANNGYGCIMGGRAGSGNNDFQLTTFNNTYTNYNGTFRFGTGDDGTKSKDAGITRGEICTVELFYRAANGSYRWFVNAKEAASSCSSYTWNNPKPIYLFGLNNNGTFSQSGNGCRIYSANFYNTSTLVRKFIPCKRKSDNTVGMYEFVNNAFYPLITA